MKRLQRVVCVCTALIALMAGERRAHAQFVVSDPTNLIQNTTSAASEVVSAENSIQQKLTALEQLARTKEALERQAEQLNIQIENIQKLDVGSLGDLTRTFDYIGRLIDREFMWLGMSLIEIVQDYERLYGPSEPSKHEGPAFEADRKSWADNVEDRYRANIEGRAVMRELKSKLYAQSRTLDGESRNVSGQLAATELNTKTLGVNNGYQALILEAYLGHTEGEQLAELERRRLREAATTRMMGALGRGMGTYQSSAAPVVLKEF